MASSLRFPRELVRRLEMDDFPLQALDAVRLLRGYLAEVECMAIVRARQLGASPADIARALGVTRQGAHHKIRSIQKQRPELHAMMRDAEATVDEPELEPQLDD